MKSLTIKFLMAGVCIGLIFGIGVASAQVSIDFQTLDTGPDVQAAYGQIIDLFKTTFLINFCLSPKSKFSLL